MNNNNESEEIIVQTVIIILFSLFTFGILFYFFHSPQDTKEWIFAFLTLVGSLLGGFTTMLAVYKTIKYDNIQRNISERKILFEKEENKKEKLNKLKMILKYEVEMYTVRCESIVLDFINAVVAQWDKENIQFIQVSNSDFYELSSNFKEFIYELLMISSEKNNDEIKRLFDFYNNFVNVKAKVKNSKYQNIPRILSKGILSEEVNDLLDYVTVNQMWIKAMKDSYGCCNQNVYTEGELDNKISKLYDEFDQGIIHYNKEVKHIINFLSITVK
ncbi:MAG: hypothetical protein E6931_11645 [Clostridium botulinum]|nr:hypothetical protein [Clostridium botulinum]